MSAADHAAEELVVDRLRRRAPGRRHRRRGGHGRRGHGPHLVRRPGRRHLQLPVRPAGLVRGARRCDEPGRAARRDLPARGRRALGRRPRPRDHPQRRGGRAARSTGRWPRCRSRPTCTRRRCPTTRCASRCCACCRARRRCACSARVRSSSPRSPPAGSARRCRPNSLPWDWLPGAALVPRRRRRGRGRRGPAATAGTSPGTGGPSARSPRCSRSALSVGCLHCCRWDPVEPDGTPPASRATAHRRNPRVDLIRSWSARGVDQVHEDARCPLCRTPRRPRNTHRSADRALRRRPRGLLPQARAARLAAPDLGSRPRWSAARCSSSPPTGRPGSRPSRSTLPASACCSA